VQYSAIHNKDSRGRLRKLDSDIAMKQHHTWPTAEHQWTFRQNLQHQNKVQLKLLRTCARM